MDLSGIFVDQDDETKVVRYRVEAAFISDQPPAAEDNRVHLAGIVPADDTWLSARNARRAAFAYLETTNSWREWLRALAVGPIRRTAWALAALLIGSLNLWACARLGPALPIPRGLISAAGIVSAVMTMAAAVRALGLPLFPNRGRRRRQATLRRLSLATVEWTLDAPREIDIDGESAGGAFFLALLDAAYRDQLIPAWSRWTPLVTCSRPVVVCARIRDSGVLDGIGVEWEEKFAELLRLQSEAVDGDDGALVLGASKDSGYLAGKWRQHFGEPLRFRRTGACEVARQRGLAFVFADRAADWLPTGLSQMKRAAGWLFRACLICLLWAAGWMPTLLSSQPPRATATPSPRRELPSLTVVRFVDLEEEPTDNCLARAVRQRMEDNLRAVEGVRVFAWETLRLEQKARSLSALDAAARLRIDKLVGGTCHLLPYPNGTPRQTGPLALNADVTDVESRIASAGDAVHGTLSTFMSTVGALSLRVLDRLQVTVGRDEAANIQREDMTYDNYCGFLGLSRKARASGAPPPRTYAATQGLAWLAAAFADDTPSAAQELTAIVQRYGQVYEEAYRTRNPDLLAPFYVEFTPDIRSALQDYFNNADGLVVTFSDIDLRIIDHHAAVTFTRTDQFTDRRSGLSQRMRARLTKVLVKSAVGWQIAPEE